MTDLSALAEKVEGLTPTQAKVIAVLSAEWASIPEIAWRLNTASNSVSRAARELTDKGLAERDIEFAKTPINKWVDARYRASPALLRAKGASNG